MKLKKLFNNDMSPNWEVFRETFPEMLSEKHSKRWHKEGTPFEHTKLVTKAMQCFLSREKVKVDTEAYLMMMSAAMLHDIGKPSTTYWDESVNDWCCKNHGRVGEQMFRTIFQDENIAIRECVAYMIRYHMLLHHILDNSDEKVEKELIQLINGTVGIEGMILLNECDLIGTINEENTTDSIIEHIVNIKKIVEKLKSSDRCNQWHYSNKESVKVYVMVGLAGSGKSTYAKKLQKELLIMDDIHVPIISRDVIRHEIGLCDEDEKFLGNKHEEETVTNVMDIKMSSLIKKRRSFIIDNTSLKKQYRDNYKKYFEQYNILPIYIYVEAPSLNENFKRRDGQIDKSVIQKMWDTMDFPSKSECYELRFVDGDGIAYTVQHD